MPNTIYSSEKVLPYVYMGIHKETGQFYIGYREANHFTSSKDLGTKYFTSSKKVKELGFDNFNWTILAEFFEGKEAFMFEQEIIFQNIKNPLILNNWVNNKFYSTEANVGKKASITTKQKMSKSRKGKKHSEETKRKIGLAHKGKVVSDETKLLLKEVKTGKTDSEETKSKKSNSAKNKVFSEQHLKNLSEAAKGVPKSEAHKQAMKQPKPKITCPHCGTIGGGQALMNRWHFDNCKLLTTNFGIDFSLLQS